MGKFMVCVLIVAMASAGVSQAANGKKAGAQHASWDAVEALTPGTEINIQSANQAGLDVCLVSAVEETMLTCLDEDSASNVRLIFPRSEVRDVWVVELAPDRHIGVWLGMGVGFFLGAGLCAEKGAQTILICGALGATIAAGVAKTTPPPGANFPLPMPPPPRMRRRLVYRMP